MKFLIYILIAIFVAFQANAQEKKSGNTIPEKSQTESQQVYPLGTESATEATNVVIEPDVYAVINGGPTDFLLYVNKNMRYPEAALAEGVEGKVMVLATIGADGRVVDAEVQNGVRDDLNQEALRLVREMPAWHPAQLGGKPVATKAVVMVPFKLSINGEPYK